MGGCHRLGGGIRRGRSLETGRRLGDAMDREVRALGLPRERSVRRRRVRNSRRRRCLDSTVETSRFADSRGPHGGGVVHPCRGRRIPARHSAACPWRPRLSHVLVAPSADRINRSCCDAMSFRTGDLARVLLRRLAALHLLKYGEILGRRDLPAGRPTGWRPGDTDQLELTSDEKGGAPRN
jgi:hypothetical protein